MGEFPRVQQVRKVPVPRPTVEVVPAEGGGFTVAFGGLVMPSSPKFANESAARTAAGRFTTAHAQRAVDRHFHEMVRNNPLIELVYPT